MKELIDFLNSQDILQIAPQATEPWIANVMFLADENCQLYFAGNLDTKYGGLLQNTNNLAFATAWHAKDNHIDRKGIQGLGVCEVVKDAELIDKTIETHNQTYPTLSDLIKHSVITDPDNNWNIFKITPTYIKFWNDELYKQDSFKEFNF